MALSKSKQLKKIVDKHISKLTKRQVKQLERLYNLSDSAFIYDITEYIGFSEDELYNVIEDALDYDNQAMINDELTDSQFSDLYNGYIEECTNLNFRVEQLVKAKIDNLSTFAPVVLRERLNKATVFIIERQIWVALDETIKLVVDIDNEGNVIDIQLNNITTINKFIGNADLPMYIYCLRDEVIDNDVKDLLKVWVNEITQIETKMMKLKSIIVDNLLYFSKRGVKQMEFKKSNASKNLHFSLLANLQYPDTVQEIVNSGKFRRYWPKNMNLTKSNMSYIHTLADYVIRFKYKVKPGKTR